MVSTGFDRVTMTRGAVCIDEAVRQEMIIRSGPGIAVEIASYNDWDVWRKLVDARDDQLAALLTRLFSPCAIFKMGVQVEQLCGRQPVLQPNPGRAHGIWHAPITGANIRCLAEPKYT